MELNAARGLRAAGSEGQNKGREVVPKEERSFHRRKSKGREFISQGPSLQKVPYELLEESRLIQRSTTTQICRPASPGCNVGS